MLTNGPVDDKVFVNWLRLLRDHAWPGPIYQASDMYPVAGRNQVVRDAFSDREWWTDLLFWDCDQVPPVGLLERLEEVAGREPIIGGLYYMRSGDFKPHAYEHDPFSWPPYRHVSDVRLLEMISKRGLYQVDAVATGAMLIRKPVLEHMTEEKKHLKPPRPLFEAPLAGERGESASDDVIAAGYQWTEDLWFCYEATRTYGYRVWLDTVYESGHISQQVVGSRTWLATHRPQLLERAE